jgi:hypothetical protein
MVQLYRNIAQIWCNSQFIHQQPSWWSSAHVLNFFPQRGVERLGGQELQV